MVVVVAVAAGGLAWGVFGGRAERAAARLLQSDNPEARKQGAWLAARERTPGALAEIANRLQAHHETDPSVRAAYVYALGRSGDAAYFDRVAAIVRDDDDAFLRHAAWLAAVRADPRRFPELAATAPVRDEPWDQIGRAAAGLEVGDTRGATVLLRWAADGDPQQQQVAALALYRGVAPLLEATGRWPPAFTVREGEPWPGALVAEVRRRCAALDLQAIADDTRPHWAYAAPVRRDVARLTSLRERLAGLLWTH
jgi:hypothetical protein